jgi:hypothetical protein
MVKVKKDLTGQTFGRLTVLYQIEDYITPGGRHMDQWRCKCACKDGQELNVIGGNLRKKNGTRSCGCLRKEFCSQSFSKTNPVDLSGEFGVGWTSNTNKEFYFDLEDYDKIKDYCWYENIGIDGYHRLNAYIKETQEYKTMAQVIIGDYYDHQDRDPFNNRKSNLRKSNKFQNAQNHNKQKNNTSGIIGVGWHKASNKWYAEIQVKNKDLWLGVYDNKEDAITIRLKAEEKYFGEFAPQKHLFKQYKINVIGGDN